jgi:4-amino-4-deoxy-L-arabinose transferase-like glycosyltransferase
MQLKSKTAIFLLIIALVSFLFRFWNLTSYPINLSMDEVAIGYNAYSILNTGLDEWGQKMPLAFKSAGDYKPPVNVYLTALSIMTFGYNDFAVRFPSAFIGSITPLVVFFLLLELSFSAVPAFLASLWLAVLPWHIHFSRASFEAITALFFLILGALSLTKWFHKHHRIQLFIATIAFSLAVWAYHAERLFVPLIVLFLLAFFRKEIRFSTYLKSYILTLIILAFFAIPFIQLSIFTPAVATRAAATSILRDPRLNLTLTHQLLPDTYRIFLFWLGKYVDYFDLKFIGWQGLSFTPPELPGVGLLNIIDIPLLLLAIYLLFQKSNSKIRPYIIAFILLGPLPASFTTNDQHPLRALTWIPAFVFLMALSFTWLSRHLRLLVGYSIGLAICLIYFFNIYTVQFPMYFSEYWQYGFTESAKYACANLDKFDRVVFSDTFGSYGPLNTGLPHYYVLFYCQTDPKIFLSNNQQIPKFEIRRPDWKYDQFKPRELLIASPWDILDYKIPQKNIIKNINFLNGRSAFILIKT